MKIFDDWYTDNFIKDHNHVPTPGMRAMLETGWNAGQKSVLDILHEKRFLDPNQDDRQGWNDCIDWVTKAISKGAKVEELGPNKGKK